MLYNNEPSPRIARLYIYHLLASKYGWTPEQVDNMEYWIIRGLIRIIVAEMKAGRAMAVESELNKMMFGGGI